MRKPKRVLTKRAKKSKRRLSSWKSRASKEDRARIKAHNLQVKVRVNLFSALEAFINAQRGQVVTPEGAAITINCVQLRALLFSRN
jgi:hypothetical protein